MARYRDARCRQCRREGVRLYLKGDRCYTPKCAVERRTYPPGQHGQGRRKMSDYGLQLREKQKLRKIYGVLERQFRRYFQEAERRPGVTGENLLQLLERRLDNAVYRLGFAGSRSQARQLVAHEHFAVNGRTVNVPSYVVRPSDVIEVREGSKQAEPIRVSLSAVGTRRLPEWLELDAENMRGTIVSFPRREDIDVEAQEQLVVEYYSR
ncbi:MAG: 30S ribosomal protein S4 [Armatimonadota bacterium]|nr:MAG: 30S ribosomal protein S4 [Armatimonadota bacterium]